MVLDTSSIAALLGAAGTFLSAATAFLKLWSAPQREKVLVSAMAGIFFASSVLAIGGGLSLYQKYLDLKRASEQALRLASILPDFGSVDFVQHHDNSTPKILVQEGALTIPDSVPQYRVTPSGFLAPSNPPHYVQRPSGDKYIFYESMLNEERCGWSSFAIIPRQPVNLQGRGNLVFLLQSANADLLEIKLKDDSGNADLRPLPVRRGWGEYFLPLDQFPDVHLELVQELSVAHSCDFAKRNAQLIEQPRFEDTFRFRLISTHR